MQQLERSRVESNLLHKDVLKERDKQLQNHLIDFNNEPLAMDAPPLGLSVPLHQSRVLPAIPPTQTLSSGPCPSEPRPYLPSAARRVFITTVPTAYYEPSTISPKHIWSFKHRIAASYFYISSCSCCCSSRFRCWLDQ